MAELAQFLRERRYNLARQGLIPPLPEVTERLNEAQKYEKQIAAKLAQAQAVEERLNAIMQDSVTDHVRAQLQMRAQPQHSAAWQAASRVEREMFAKMEKARVDHDQARKALNAIAAEHVKISSEIARKKSNPGQFFNEILDSKPLPDMGNGNLYAPVAGKILLVNFAVGQRIDSVTPLFVILPTSTKDASDVWIQALFPLKDAKKIEPGQKVSIRFEKSGIHVSGHVTAVSNEAQALPATQSQAKPTSINHLAASEDDSDRNAARYVPVRIAPNNPSELAGLDPGATASCQIQTRYVLGHNLF